MVHAEIKFLIIRRFPIQADFAQVINKSESMVSRAVRGRRKISQEEAKLWASKLGCDVNKLAPIIHPEDDQSNAPSKTLEG